MINNRLLGFIDRDSRPRYQKAGSHRYAKNMVRSTELQDSGGMTNELSTKFCAKVPGAVVVGYHRLEERNQTLFFHIENGSAISIFDHKTNKVTPVVKDTDFGCEWKFKPCQWLGFGHSLSKTIAPCNELILYFSSDDIYYKVNIDEMLDPKRKEAIKKLDKPCEYFELIKCVSAPRGKGRSLRAGGRDLPPGQYYYSARLYDESGNKSNWSPIEGPLFIGSKYNKFTDTSRESIRLEYRNLNKEYSRIEIAIIPPIGSQEQDVAWVIYDGSYSTNGAEVTYYSSSQHFKAVPIAELLVKDIKFLRGAKMAQDEGKLHLFQTRQEFNPDLQQHYNKAQVYIDAYLVPADKAHLFPSLPHDEVIAVGVQPVYCDQTVPPTFHVPGRDGGSNPFTCACDDLPPGHTGNNASLVKNHLPDLQWNGEEWCFNSGRQLTENELNAEGGTLPQCGTGEQAIEPRSSDDDNNCVSGVTDRNAVQDKIDATKTDNDDLDSCLDCASQDVKDDLDQTQGFLTEKLEHITDLFRTDEDVADNCTIGDHTTIREAAKTLYNEGIKDAEKDEEIKYRTSLEKSGGKSITGLNTSRTTVRGDDCVIEDIQPILWQTWLPASWESEIEYPKTTNCEGEYHYRELAGQRIRHIKTMGPHQVPFAITAQTGVENRHDPSNVPGKDTYVVKLGLRVENVYIPSYDAGEIPKPLDQNTPYRIVIGKPDAHNKSTLMWGYATHTYKGIIGGKEFAVPRAGVNAYPACDQSIDNDGSHLGEDWTEAIYNIHSPNALLEGGDVSGDYIQVYGRLHGKGWVYGQYGKDKGVKDEDNPKDRRGMRGAVNLNNFDAYDTPFQTCIKGIEFAEFNTSLQNPDGIDYPLLNKHREASLYVQTEEAFPTIGTDNKDHSCNGGGLDHEYPTDGEAWLVAVKRINKQQYGSLESLQYIDIGLKGRKDQTTVFGLVGTVYVQKWSHKRTNFFSDKVGNILNKDLIQYGVAASDFLGPAGIDGRDRGVCDPPNRRGYRMKDFMGFWNGNTLPENGDKKDPKNMANMHPTKFANELNTVWAADTDLFFPRTFTCLNHLYIESDINLHFRSTGLPATREIFYEELQGVDLDSSIHSVEPSDAWLDDFHSEQLQASKKQANRKIMIRVFLTLIVPALFGWTVASIDTPLQAGFAMFSSPFVVSLWLLCVYNIFSPKKIDKFLGIPECKTDDEGAQDEDNLRGLKDNWFDYNYGYSSINDLNVFLSMPFIYNTCKCTKYSNIIYSSNRQIHTSPWDAYSNFQALSFTGIPADTGLLQHIVVVGNRVMAITTDSLFLLQQKGVSIATSMGEQLLGSSAFLEQPVKIADIGTEDPNSLIPLPNGFLMWDRESRSFVLYNGQYQKLNDTDCGLYEYMKDYTPFCSEGECTDQLTPTSTHYAFGIDPELRKYVITKHDSNPWTWSYGLDTNKFISEHTYVPDFYFWDRFKLYGVKDGNIYRFNEEGSYGTYFGEKAESEIEVVATPNLEKDMTAFMYKDTELDTEVNEIVDGSKPTLFDRKSTFNTVTIYNDIQTTGELPIVFKESSETQRKPEIVLGRSSETLNWTFNRVRSNEIDRDVPIIKYSECNGIPAHNDENADGKNQANTAKYVKSRYLIYRFKYDNKDQIIFHGLLTRTDKDG